MTTAATDPKVDGVYVMKEGEEFLERPQLLGKKASAARELLAPLLEMRAGHVALVFIGDGKKQPSTETISSAKLDMSKRLEATNVLGVGW
jgi:hypothetical protein